MCVRACARVRVFRKSINRRRINRLRAAAAAVVKTSTEARVALSLAVLGSAIVWQLSLLMTSFPGYLLQKKPPSPKNFADPFSNRAETKDDKRSVRYVCACSQLSCISLFSGANFWQRQLALARLQSRTEVYLEASHREVEFKPAPFHDIPGK